MNEPRFPIAVTAEDETGPVLDKVKKRLEGVKRAGDRVGRGLGGAATPATVSRLGIVARTLGRVEAAAAGAFGNRSVIAEAAGRLGRARSVIAEVSGSIGQIGAASRAAGQGLGAAGDGAVAAAAGMSRFGVVAGATVGVVAAAAYGAFRLAGGWAKGAQALGNLSDMTGIAGNRLQALQSVAVRAGVSKEDANGAIAAFSQGVYDAQYGRNDQVRATLARLKIRTVRDRNGNIDREAMLSQVADAVARVKDAGAGNLIAANLGLTALLPVLRRGGKALKAELADAAAGGPQTDAAGIDLGRRTARADARLNEIKERAVEAAGRKTAEGVTPVVEGGTGILRSITDAIGFTRPTGAGDAAAGTFTRTVSGVFAPAATDIRTGGADILSAARAMAAAGIGGAAGVAGGVVRQAAAAGSAIVAGAGRLSQGVIAAAKAAEARHGIPASVIAAQYQLESGGGRHMPAGSNNPFGHKARPGQPYVEAMTTEVVNGASRRVRARFAKYDNLSDAFDAHAQMLAERKRYAGARAADDDDGFARGLQAGGYATDPRYADKLIDIMHRQPAELTHRHHHTFSGLPAGVKVRTDSGDGVAVNHALAGPGL